MNTTGSHIARWLLSCFLIVAPLSINAKNKAPNTKEKESTPHCQGDCVPIGKWQFDLSIGYGIRTNPVVDQDNIPFVIVPRITYYGKRFFLDSYDLGYTLYDKGVHQLNAILITPGFEQTFFNRWDLRNFDLGDATFEAGMPGVASSTGGPDTLSPSEGAENAPTPSNIKLRNRETAGLSGIEYTYIHQYFDWQTQILQDVTRLHKGQKVRSAISIPFQSKRDFFEVSLGAFWQSRELIDYYYGVDNDEVYDTSLSYQAPSSTAFYLSGEWEKRLSKRWGLRGVISHKWLGSGVTNSPIVKEKTVTTAFFAGVYHF